MNYEIYMHLVNNFKEKYKFILINLLFCFLPAAIIIGNSIVNINIVLFIIFSLIFFYKDLLTFKFNNIDKLVLSIFIFSLFTSAYNILQNYISPFELDFDTVPEVLHSHYITFLNKYDFNYLILKAIGYSRFFIFYFLVRMLLDKNIINLKFIYYSASFLCIFVMFDVVFQFINGKDIFGLNSPHPRKFSGPFGSELVAGGYILNFSFFALSLPFSTQLFKNKKSIYLFPLFILIISSLIMAGNRMSIILFLFTLGFFSIFKQKYFNYFLIILINVFFLIFFLKKNNPLVNHNINHFQASVVSMINISKNVLTNNFEDSDRQKNDFPEQFREFETFYDTWQLNKYIGGGIRSYRFNCTMRGNISLNERITCNTHPHNYYLEIITDLGIFGLLAFSFLFFKVFIESLKITFLNKSRKNFLLFPFIMILFVEIFPLKSSGSFFFTTNSLIVFMCIAVLVSFIKKDNIEKLEK